MYVIKIGYRCTSQEVIPSKPPGGSERQRPHHQKEWVIYRYKCDRVKCDEEYTGGSSRTFVDRFKEHLKDCSPIHDHYNIRGHATTKDNFSIVQRQNQNLMRTIREEL